MIQKQVRLDAPYNLNEAGAKKYVLDQIEQMDSYIGNDISIFNLMNARVTGALFGLFSVGLIDVFNFEELKQKLAISFNRFLDRITSPVEQM